MYKKTVLLVTAMCMMILTACSLTDNVRVNEEVTSVIIAEVNITNMSTEQVETTVAKTEPVTEVPTTEQPTTEAPTTEAPTEAPTEPVTEAPTPAPTIAPTQPATQAPTTMAVTPPTAAIVKTYPAGRTTGLAVLEHGKISDYKTENTVIYADETISCPYGTYKDEMAYSAAMGYRRSKIDDNIISIHPDEILIIGTGEGLKYMNGVEYAAHFNETNKHPGARQLVVQEIGEY